MRQPHIDGCSRAAFNRFGLRSRAILLEEVWPEMIHVWHSFAEILPEGRRAIEGIATFLQKKVNQRASSA